MLHKNPVWKVCDKKLREVDLRLDGTIEDDGVGMGQVDFANKKIGGGVLGWVCRHFFSSASCFCGSKTIPIALQGSVQEEIRFLICPELIVSRLFVEQLFPTEAIVITGVER